MKKILIGSDKSGFTLKEAIRDHLVTKGWTIEDCGTRDPETPLPYFEVAPLVAQRIQRGEVEKAILICGTGMGMAVVANKYKGVYAACVESLYAAEKCRSINDANILTMGGWVIGNEMGCALAETFLNTGFTQNLEPWRKEFLQGAQKRVAQIEQSIYENQAPLAPR